MRVRNWAVMIAEICGWLNIVDRALLESYMRSGLAAEHSEDQYLAMSLAEVRSEPRWHGVDPDAALKRLQNVEAAVRHEIIVQTNVPPRLDRMPWAPFHNRLVFTLAMSWVSVGLLDVAPMALFKSSIETSLSLSSTAWVITFLFLFGTALGALLFGWLADWFGRGRRFIFLVSLGLCALGGGLTVFSSSVRTLAVFRFITGIGIGGQYIAMNAMLQELMPARRRGWACVAVYGCFWLGPVLGVLGVGVLSSSLPQFVWKIGFSVGAAFCAIVCLFGHWIPESPRWLMALGYMKEAEIIVAGIEKSLPRSRLAVLPSVKPVSFDTRVSRPTLINLLKILHSKYPDKLLLCSILMSVQAVLYNTFISGGMDLMMIQLVPIALANFFGPVVLGWLVDGPDGRRLTMAMAFSASGVLLFATSAFWLVDQVFCKGYFTAAGYFTVAWTAIFFFASIAASTAYLTAGEMFPQEIRAPAFAVVFVATMLLAGCGSLLLFGLVIDSARTLITVSMVVAVVMILVGVAVRPRRFLIPWVGVLSYWWLPNWSGKSLSSLASHPVP
jgi:MFS family permease